MSELMMNEDIFMLFQHMPDALPLYQAAEAYINELFPTAKRKVSKTQVSFSCRYGFAWLWPPMRRMKNTPKVYLLLTFGLDHEVRHPRIFQAVEPYPGRWTHHVIISDVADLDEQVAHWLKQSWNFSMTK